MTEQRIKLNNIIQNQIPSYVREEFPLISEFLKQYYIAQEFQGAPVDLIQNIDRYIKLDETTSNVESVILGSNIEEFDSTISVDLVKSPSGTSGFAYHQTRFYNRVGSSLRTSPRHFSARFADKF